MEIRIGEYILHSDNCCYWMDREVKTKNGKTWLKRVSGYYPNIEGVFKSFVDRKLRGDGITEMKEFLALADKTRNELIKLAERVGTELDTKLAERVGTEDGATQELAEQMGTERKRKGAK